MNENPLSGHIKPKITAQAVGAFGEKAAEAELLRRYWIPSNINATVKDAAEFDILAYKDGCATVSLRVKTCGPGQNAFQFSFDPGKDISFDNLHGLDFTILVRMGKVREDDHFYILPTSVLRQELYKYRRLYLATRKRDGLPRKDTGQWTIRLAGMRSGEVMAGKGLEKKWASYRDNWALLEDASLPKNSN
jgi:hypothetical protein